MIRKVASIAIKVIIAVFFVWFAYDSTVIALRYEKDKAAAIGRGLYNE